MNFEEFDDIPTKTLILTRNVQYSILKEGITLNTMKYLRGINTLDAIINYRIELRRKKLEKIFGRLKNNTYLCNVKIK